MGLTEPLLNRLWPKDKPLSVATILWILLGAAAFLRLWSWPQLGVALGAASLCWWQLVVYFSNCSDLQSGTGSVRHAAVRTRRAPGVLLRQNWVLLPSACANGAACVMSLLNAGRPVFFVSLLGLVLAVAAQAAGIDDDLPTEPAGTLSRRSWLRKVLDGLSAPKWVFGRGWKFAGALIYGGLVLLFASVSYIQPSMAAIPHDLNHRLPAAHYPQQRATSPSSTGGKKSAPPASDRPTPSPTPRAPVSCSRNAMVNTLRQFGLGPAAAERVYSAQHFLAWPNMGCDVRTVGKVGATVSVVFTGGEADGVVVDDGRAANAAIGPSATRLLEVDRVGMPGSQVAGISESRRAGVVRWQLVALTDGGCRLLEVPDGGEAKAYEFAPSETIQLAKTAHDLALFPVATEATGGQLGNEIQLFGSTVSAPGYRLVESLDPADYTAGTVQIPLDSCVTVSGLLVDLGSQLQRSATARQ